MSGSDVAAVVLMVACVVVAVHLIRCFVVVLRGGTAPRTEVRAIAVHMVIALVTAVVARRLVQDTWGGIGSLSTVVLVLGILGSAGWIIGQWLSDARTIPVPRVVGVLLAAGGAAVIGALVPVW